MIVRIATEEGELLGYAEPPEDWADRWPNWNDIHKTLDLLFQTWHEEEPEPDRDSQFVDWLVEEHGWTINGVEVIEHNI